MNNKNQEIKYFNRVEKFFYGLLLTASDLIFGSISCLVAYYLRFYSTIFGASKPTYIFDIKYFIYSAVFVCALFLISLAFRLYFWNSIYKESAFYGRVILAILFALIIMFSAGRLFENFPFSRLWVFSLFIVSVILIVLSRLVIGILTKIMLKNSNYNTDSMFVTFGESIGALKYLTRFKKKFIYGIVLIISDIVFLILAFVLSYYVRFNTGELGEINNTYIIEKNYFFYSFIFILAAILIFFIYGLYDRDRIYKGSGYYSKLFKAVTINIIVIILAGYVFDLYTFSRKWILLLFLFSLIMLYISRYLIEYFVQRFSKKLGIVSKTIIIGIGENAKRIEDSLKKYSKEADIVIGHVDKKQRIEKKDEYTNNLSILGKLEDIRQIILNNNVQRIIISSPEFKYFEILEILENLKGMDITILIFPGFFEFSLRRMSVREIGGVPLMQVANIGFFGFNLFLKNLLDYFLGIIIFIFFIPIYLIVALMIKLNSHGPVFFIQKRMTKDCKIFYMYKFRSMYVDAEERLKDLLKYNEASGPLFKMKNDPRITRVGKFLRKFSIDEVPQIINVLKGELSIVGPRAPLPSEVEKYDEWEVKRMNVKQGITGLWQISGRSDLSFEEMARLDLYYIQNWSIMMDIKIILKTIPAAIFSKGAY